MLLLVGCVPPEPPPEPPEPEPPERVCDQPLPCETEWGGAPTSCGELLCTAGECWQHPVRRAATPEGTWWCDGEYWAACDRTGALRAYGEVDARGRAACAWDCAPGHCPQRDGERPPPCDGIAPEWAPD